VKKTPRYLLAGEPQSTFIPNLDTGVTLAAEILSRGFHLDYCDLKEMDWRLPSAQYLSALRVSRVTAASHREPPAFTLESVRAASVEEYDVILQRKDPPVDDDYIGHAKQFTAAPARIVQMNNPDLTWRLSEHLLPSEYPEYSVPTYLCENYVDFTRRVREMPGDSVCKPMNLFSGWGISFFSPQADESELKTYWEKWKPQIIVQPYVPEVTTIGDLRVLVINEKIVGSVLRKPAAGSRLANLHQGGSAHFWQITPRQIEASKAIARDLCPRGLYLLGIDFIGEWVSEVNITCPSALPQINSVMGIRGETVIIDELERLRQSAR
jgi:glutathione synthase